MNFGNLSLYLWSAAVLLFSAGCVSAYFLLSFLWRLPERMPKTSVSMLLKHGDLDLLSRPPRKLTAEQIAKMLIIPLVAGLLIGYGAGTWTKYSREYAAWKTVHEQQQKDFFAWSAKYSKEIR